MARHRIMGFIFGVFSFFGLTMGTLAVEVRVASYNVEQGVGDIGTVEYAAVSSVLARVDADIVAMQELYLSTDHYAAWTNLASDLGYDYYAISDSSSCDSLCLAYYSRYPILSATNITSPAGASDLARYPFRAEIEVDGAAHPLVIWNLHNKSSDTSEDSFRRAVEIYRTTEDMESYLLANPENDEFIVLGDMNDDDRESQPASFSSASSFSFPACYTLGSDITFPVYYATFPGDHYEVIGDGVTRLTLYQEDSLSEETHISTTPRKLDYIFVSDAIENNPLGAPVGEIYYSELDDGVGGLAKVGDPLPSETSTNASDHLLLFTDIQMTDDLTVDPDSAQETSGYYGGPFSPATFDYSITNSDTAALTWTLTSDVSWLTLSTAGSTLASGDSSNITVALNSVADALAEGDHTANLTFQADDGRTAIRKINLDVLYPPSFQASTNDLSFSGYVGGPFSSQTFSLTNNGGGALTWTSSYSATWLSISSATGTLEVGATTQLTVSVNSIGSTLAEGSYTTTLSINNLTNGKGDTNINVNLTVTTIDTSEFTEDAENGGLGWTTTGMWNIVDSSETCGKASSPTHAWRYGTNSVCTYATGGTANSGRLTSVDFNIPVDAYLTFSSWEQTESASTAWDKRIVSISTDSGGSWTTLNQSTNNTAAWYTKTIALTNYAGATARLCFEFNTRDSFANDFGGWYIDDIRVAASRQLAVSVTNSLASSGNEGGDFNPSSYTLVLTNKAYGTLSWNLTNTLDWITASVTSGTLDYQQTTNVIITVNANADALDAGLYTNIITIVNLSNGNGSTNMPLTLLIRDGIDDVWRELYFGHVEPNADDESRAEDDADGDGFNTLDEYIYDTSPTDVSDYFTFDLSALDDETLQLMYRSSTGRLYTVEYSDDLPNSWLPVSDLVEQVGEDGVGTFTTPAETDFRTYRMRVKLPSSP